MGPRVKAVEKMSEFYFNLRTDPFTPCVSLAGISRQLMFSEAENKGVSFGYIQDKDEDLYLRLRKNCFGGTSMMIKREAIQNETYIRNGPKKLVL